MHNHKISTCIISVLIFASVDGQVYKNSSEVTQADQVAFE